MYPKKNNAREDCRNRINLTNLFRLLWEQHVMWTRSFIISTAADLGDLQLVTQRLLENPVDFASEWQKYYGKQKAEMFQRLFTEHLTIAAQLVNDAKQGNSDAVEMDRKKWYQNADEIAAFLASINPFWSKKAWQTMLYSHLKLTEEEATSRLNGEYASDIAIYDEIEAEALEMADMMTDGIIKQFGD